MTQWSDLTKAQRAVLRCWGPEKSEMDCDYPRPMAEETRVMEELAALGLFRIETYEDAQHGPCQSVSVTPAGIALAGENAEPNAGSTPTDAKSDADGVER